MGFSCHTRWIIAEYTDCLHTVKTKDCFASCGAPGVHSAVALDTIKSFSAESFCPHLNTCRDSATTMLPRRSMRYTTFAF